MSTEYREPDSRPILQNTPIQVWLPALIFTSVLIFFLMAVFFLTPNMTLDQRNITLLLFALLAGFSTFFLGGTALLEIAGGTSQGTKLGLSATAGVAVFVLCYLYPPYFFKKGSVEPDVRPADSAPATTPALSLKKNQFAPGVKDKPLANTGQSAGQPHAQGYRSIFLVRHAEIESRVPDAPISQEGKRRAEKLAELLEGYNIATIYTSFLSRAIMTAEPLAQKLHVTPTIIPLQYEDLRKIAWEILQNRDLGDILIVGHSNTLPSMVNLLNLDSRSVNLITENDYDFLFKINISTTEPPRLTSFRIN